MKVEINKTIIKINEEEKKLLITILEDFLGRYNVSKNRKFETEWLFADKFYNNLTEYKD